MGHSTSQQQAAKNQNRRIYTDDNNVLKKFNLDPDELEGSDDNDADLFNDLV